MHLGRCKHWIWVSFCLIETSCENEKQSNNLNSAKIELYMLASIPELLQQSYLKNIIQFVLIAVVDGTVGKYQNRYFYQFRYFPSHLHQQTTYRLMINNLLSYHDKHFLFLFVRVINEQQINYIRPGDNATMCSFNFDIFVLTLYCYRWVDFL